MKSLKKFNLLFKQISQEIETYNDKPGFPGGNNLKHTDAGSQTGNTCKFSTDPGNIGGKTDTCQGLCDQDINNSNYKFDIGNHVFVCLKNGQIKHDAIIRNRETYGGVNFYDVQFPFVFAVQKFPEYQLGFTDYFPHMNLLKESKQNNFKYQLGQKVYVYNFASNISNNEFKQDQEFQSGIICDRNMSNDMNFYGVQFSNMRAIFSYPEWKLGITPKDAKLNYFTFKYNQQHQVEEDACACAAGIGTANVMGPTPGMPSIADTAGGSKSAQKAVTDPGVTTKDISQIYSPALNNPPKTKKVKKQTYPLFSRLKK